MAKNNEQNESYKQKIKNLSNENVSLGDEIRTAQDNIRLSANQIVKIKNELKIVCGEN